MKLEQYVRRHTSDEIYKHCVATAEMAANLAEHHGLDSRKAWEAGLLHDVARSLDDAELIRQAARLGIEPSDVEKDNPVLLHAKIAARMAQDELGIVDPQILEAIAAHTTGKRGMGKLARVVFVADYAEPTRDMPGVEGVRALLPDHLNDAVLAVLKNKMDYVRRLGGAADPSSMQLWNALARKAGVKGNNT
jgi:predicted HD superfamily hydrolase involved in NAD metabolism